MSMVHTRVDVGIDPYGFYRMSFHTVGENCVRPNREAADGTHDPCRTNAVVLPLLFE